MPSSCSTQICMRSAVAATLLCFCPWAPADQVGGERQQAGHCGYRLCCPLRSVHHQRHCQHVRAGSLRVVEEGRQSRLLPMRIASRASVRHPLTKPCVQPTPALQHRPPACHPHRVRAAGRGRDRLVCLQVRPSTLAAVKAACRPCVCCLSCRLEYCPDLYFMVALQVVLCGWRARGDHQRGEGLGPRHRHQPVSRPLVPAWLQQRPLAVAAQRMIPTSSATSALANAPSY